MEWEGPLIRSGKRLVIRIPRYIVVKYRVVPGIPVRISFVDMVRLGSGEIPRLRYAVDVPTAPVMDPDGRTWTTCTRCCSSGGLSVRLPPEVVEGFYLRPGAVVRLDFLGTFPELRPGWEEYRRGRYCLGSNHPL